MISYAGKDIPEEGDMHKLLFYAGADYVLHKVSLPFSFGLLVLHGH